LPPPRAPPGRARATATTTRATNGRGVPSVTVDDAYDDDATTTRRRAMARVATLAAMVTVTPARAAESPESLYDLTVMQYGKPTPLAAYRGKVSVVVNVASE
jgi:hypothetical protein